MGSASVCQVAPTDCRDTRQFMHACAAMNSFDCLCLLLHEVSPAGGILLCGSCKPRKRHTALLQHNSFPCLKNGSNINSRRAASTFTADSRAEHAKRMMWDCVSCAK